MPKLVTQLEYLGVKLGWGRTADMSLQHRLGQGRKAFAMLSRWWRRNALAPRAQVKLYCCMVLPVLLYGLSATGVTKKGGRKLTVEVFRQLRRPFLFVASSGSDKCWQLPIVATTLLYMVGVAGACLFPDALA